MRPCPTCGKPQENLATVCENCDNPLPPASGAVPIDTPAILRTRLEASERALEQANAANSRLKAELERSRTAAAPPAPAPPAPALPALAPVPPASAPTASAPRASPPPFEPAPPPGKWSVAALIPFLRRWPKLSTSLAALMAAATAYSGFDLGKLAMGDDLTPSAPVAVAQPLPPDNPVIKERDAARDELAATKKELEATKRTLNQALAREKAARGRAAAVPARQPASAGFIQLSVLEKKADQSFDVRRDNLAQGEAWPAGRCSFVAGSRNRNGNVRTFTPRGQCDATGIRITNAGDWERGDVVRIFWTSP